MNELGSPFQSAREMTRLERWRSRVAIWLARLRRKLPYIVWYGDEIDCRVTLREIKLGEPGPMYGHIHAAQDSLRSCGVSFDSGMGPGGRDWEWDFSLQGPISVSFKSKATRPERRTARPKPKLIVNNDAA